MDAVVEPVAAPVVPQLKLPQLVGIKPGQVRDPVTGKLTKKKPPPLLDDHQSELEAMEWVQRHGEDLTNQQAYYRRLMDKEPKWFAERLRELQAENAKSVSTDKGLSVESWDGVSACPCCGRGPEVESEAEAVEVMIEALLKREVE
jgi:hypothetical protein